MHDQQILLFRENILSSANLPKAETKRVKGLPYSVLEFAAPAAALPDPGPPFSPET